jgi:monoamine oxidase
VIKSQKLPDLDVAIVGGGISGIYAAWRLATESLVGTQLADWASERGGKLKVAVYEGSSRIGGRLLSARSAHMPEVTCELGGMRYVFPTHKRVVGLVENKLKLDRHSQVVRPAQGSNIDYLRGRRLRDSDLSDPKRLPYNFDSDESSALDKDGPVALIARALQRALQNFDPKEYQGRRQELHDYLKCQRVDGRELHTWGFWNLLLSRLSGEAYNASIDTIGYDVLGANYNAVDLITEFFDFAPGTDYRMLDQGYEFLPWTLKVQFEDNGGEITTGRWLRGFDYDPNTGVSLRFDDDTLVTARAIVLAMPRRALERLLRESPPLGQMEQGLLNTVAPIPLFKLFLTYDTPWWQEAGVRVGRSLTDLPLRQCYYWATRDETQGPAVIMVYNDALNVGYWRGLRSEALPSLAFLRHPKSDLHPLELRRRQVDEKFASPPEFFQSKSPPEPRFAAAVPDRFHNQLLKNWEGEERQHVPDPHQTTEMERLLLRMHGLNQASELLDATVADWSEGGVHLWNVGSKSWEIMPKMVQPIGDDVPCYICGEAYSTYQTWVEGALQTADFVVEKLRRSTPGRQHV